MKSYLCIFASMLLGLAISTSSLAAVSPGSAAAPGGPGSPSVGPLKPTLPVAAPVTNNPMLTYAPCKNIAAACAGKGTKNQIYINCINPILAGQQVAGVNVSPSDVKACKLRMQTGAK